MQVNILLFGQLTDITGTGNMVLEDMADTNAVTRKLEEQFPALAHSKYVMAVDKKVISGNTILNNNSTVALLPPFSGG
ncbi:MAG: MoaD/ThiS family protein [Ferruginibacter sp.]